ncbi:FAD-dependent pyridine nucleotide-disulphide oxidoreductase [Kribbella flavida DSM 17836]|uniref:FAD-dependent pyridine nucleotide-disulphide oxidoreductase n=2 Tax=Kribbella flavida TaxID=182640 RepID=D2PR13_KRIFD|nr:FAD-dependent pyridine nucleotide-disulphide oxidoreductase [Kribbella flavida DSM 17836]
MRRHLVVVGASLAGLRTAEALRRLGHEGPITVVGAEQHPPYDRPPLSKGLLSGRMMPTGVRLSQATNVGADWQLGVPAVALQADVRRVELADGRTVPYDGLVIATGARAVPGGPGVRTLRSLDDAIALRQELRPGRRVAVLGGGFLGSEIAAVARERGCEVQLVTRQPLPLLTAAGEPVAAVVAELHRRAGVTLHQELASSADLVVAATGAIPNTEWLNDAGLMPAADGLQCDEWLRPLRADGSVLPDVVAAGDVVRWPHPLAQGGLVSLGHWSNAVDQAETAAYNLVFPDRARPFGAVPSFWSDLYGVQLRAVGIPRLGTPTVEEHDPDRTRLVVTYHRDSRLVGAVTLNRTSRLAVYRAHLAAQLPLVVA